MKQNVESPSVATPSPASSSVTGGRSQAIIANLESLLLNHYRKRLPKFFVLLEEKLFEFADKAADNEQQHQFWRALRQLKKHRENFARRFLLSIREGFVRFRQGKLQLESGLEDFSEQTLSLSLIQNDDLEEQIAINSIATKSEANNHEELFALERRLAVLIGGKPVDGLSNPVGPLQIATCLRDSMAVLELETKIKLVFYKVFEISCMNSMGDAYVELNEKLIKDRILPNFKYRVTKHEGEDGAADEVVDPIIGDTRSGNFQLPQRPSAEMPQPEYQRALVTAIDQLQHVLQNNDVPSEHTQSLLAAGTCLAKDAERSLDQHELLSALEKVQVWANKLTTGFDSQQSWGAGAVPVQFERQLSEQVANAVGRTAGFDSGDVDIIDLVGRLFDYMLSDEQLDNEIKAVLSYLHTPYLKAALVDAEFFRDAMHPARQLLDALAEAGCRWGSCDGNHRQEVFDNIEHVVRRVLRDFDRDLALFTEVLEEFHEFLVKLDRRKQLVEQRALEKVKGEDRIHTVKSRVHSEMHRRINQKQLPASVLRLLLQPWSDYLTYCMLRFGDESEQWRCALEVVDETIWSVQPHANDRERSRLIELMDSLEQRLSQGFDMIALDQSERDSYLNELMDAQSRAAKNQVPEMASASEREIWISRSKSQLGQLTDAAEEVEERPLTESEQKWIERLSRVSFDTWFQFDQHNDGEEKEHHHRWKLAWYNDKTGNYMFVNAMGRREAVMGVEQLARALDSGQVKIIEEEGDKHFFQRALESIFDGLHHLAKSPSSSSSTRVH